MRVLAREEFPFSSKRRLDRQGDSSVESLGPRLKREREQRKITLDEISLSTKISTRFLLAIEEEHFDQLPGGIFNKGFVRAYARSVGVDEAQAVADYELASGVNLTPETPPGGSPVPAVPNLSSLVEDSDSGASRIPWGWFAVALLIIACGFAVWGFYSRESSAKPRLLPPPPASGNGAAGAPSSIAQIRVPPSSASEGGNPVPPSPDSAPSGHPTDSPPSPGAFLVQIKARQDSWATINADGRQIMQDTLYTSAEKSVGAHDQIVIKTGNAGALEISFNGKKLPAQGAPNEVKTRTFDPRGPTR
jgi:cytoskeleton protein RodZ